MLDIKKLFAKAIGCCYTTGASGNWKWKKYADGSAEMWGTDTRSVANTDITGGESGKASKWVTYTNSEIMVVIENIGTKFLYIKFYKLGDWSLNR